MIRATMNAAYYGHHAVENVYVSRNETWAIYGHSQ